MSSDLFSVDGGSPCDTVSDCVQTYVERYWEQQADLMAWQYFSHPVPLMARTLKIRIHDAEEEQQLAEHAETLTWQYFGHPVPKSPATEERNEDGRYDQVSVDDYNETETAGRLITVCAGNIDEFDWATIGTGPASEDREQVTIEDFWLSQIAQSMVGQMIVAEVVDRGAGPRLVDIRQATGYAAE